MRPLATLTTLAPTYHRSHQLNAGVLTCWHGRLRKQNAAPSLQIAVDTLENVASNAYGALPERLVILQGGSVRFIGGRGPDEYSIDKARKALHGLLSS